MSTNIDYALATSRTQLAGVFADFPSDQWDFKVCEQAMSAREIAGHLCECYVAFDKSFTGEEHSWGTFEMPEMPDSELVGYVLTQRDAVVAKLDGSASEEVVKHAFDYVALHDCYHVGQMCTLRLTLDPEWNAYSIYGM